MKRYATVHKRITRERGPATRHRCSQCAGQANEWAYAGTDPDPVVELRRPFGGSPIPVRFSADVTQYLPLCTSCHRRHDGAAAVYPRNTLVDLRKPVEWTGRRQRCTCCEMTKDSGAFALDRRRPSGRQSRCRACNARYQVEQKARRRRARDGVASPAKTA